MKKKLLKLIGTISAFFLSIFGLTGCSDKYQVMYGVPPDIQQDLYGVPAPTQKYEMDEMDTSVEEGPEMSMTEDADSSDEL